ncbi:hypothetical protein QTG54_011579 [Skeletonema marinoi]|uniref:Sel1 repeat family protein n=1 Tax=Skeletonema marinoi TaxID=267567 RepID=A0AAD8Y1Q8_9STRA|nr:hypothetical protein QTG54_011579 [Skeletonema marinoi]
MLATIPLSDVEKDAIKRRRIEANDPITLREVGKDYYRERDYEKALQHWSRAAKLGDADAHYCLTILYLEGLGVEKDEKKRLYHLEEASIGGHLVARRNLTYQMAGLRGRDAEAVEFLKEVHEMGQEYEMGAFGIDVCDAAVRGYQAAVDATKSRRGR